MKRINRFRATLKNNGFPTSESMKDVVITGLDSNGVVTYIEPDGDIATGTTSNVYVPNQNVVVDSGFITSLTINPTTHTFNVANGDVTGVTTFSGITITNQDGVLLVNSSLTFASSNAAVVSVNASGVIKFESVGNYVTITASITSNGNLITKTMRVYAKQA